MPGKLQKEGANEAHQSDRTEHQQIDQQAELKAAERNMKNEIKPYAHSSPLLVIFHPKLTALV